VRIFYIILLSLQIFSLSAVDVTVLVHGSYPALKVLSSSWSPVRHMIYTDHGLSLAKNLPKNYYFYQIAQSFYKANPEVYNINHFYTYGWHSSNLSPQQRIQEGKKLYEALQLLIDQYSKKHQSITINLIGISHGGNVILNMLSHLPFQQENISIECILIGTPVQESTSDFINSPYVSKAYSFYSEGDWVQKLDLQKLHKDCPKNAPIMSQRVFKKTDKIQQICLTVDGRKIGHGEYRHILKYLPDMIHQIEEELVDSYCDRILYFDYKIPQSKLV
jgi:hypothetical protein